MMKYSINKHKYPPAKVIFLLLITAIYSAKLGAATTSEININGETVENDTSLTVNITNKPREFELKISGGPVETWEHIELYIDGPWLGNFGITLYNNDLFPDLVAVGECNDPDNCGSPDPTRGWLNHSVHPDLHDEPPTHMFLFKGECGAGATELDPDGCYLWNNDKNDYLHNKYSFDSFFVAMTMGFIDPVTQKDIKEWSFTLSATHKSLATFPVPIPAAIWMFGIGVFSLMGLSRRKIIKKISH